METDGVLFKNIILREYLLEDWERVHLYASLTWFTQYEAWGPNSIEDTKSFINQMLSLQQSEPRYQYEFVIIEKKSQLLIGG